MVREGVVASVAPGQDLGRLGRARRRRAGRRADPGAGRWRRTRCRPVRCRRRRALRPGREVPVWAAATAPDQQGCRGEHGCEARPARASEGWHVQRLVPPERCGPMSHTGVDGSVGAGASPASTGQVASPFSRVGGGHAASGWSGWPARARGPTSRRRARRRGPSGAAGWPRSRRGSRTGSAPTAPRWAASRPAMLDVLDREVQRRRAGGRAPTRRGGARRRRPARSSASAGSRPSRRAGSVAVAVSSAVSTRAVTPSIPMSARSLQRRLEQRGGVGQQHDVVAPRHQPADVRRELAAVLHADRAGEVPAGVGRSGPAGRPPRRRPARRR